MASLCKPCDAKRRSSGQIFTLIIDSYILLNLLELGGAVTKGLTVEEAVVVEWVEDSGGCVAGIFTVDCVDVAGVVVDDDVCVDDVVTAEDDCVDVAGVVVDADVCVDGVVTADGVCVDGTGGDEGTVTGLGVTDVCGLVSEILRTHITVDCVDVAGDVVDDDVCVDGGVTGGHEGTVTGLVGVIDVCGLESEILRTRFTVDCVVAVYDDVYVDDVVTCDDEGTVTD